jgi:flagella basal body P-ring formation protein FlgA
MARVFRNFLLAWLWLCAAGIAAEVSLRENASVDSAVVRLGDVAELYDVPEGDRAELLGIELLPSPAPGVGTTVSVREIQDTLSRRAPEFARWTFSGASQVTVSRAVVEKKAPAAPKSVRPTAVSHIAGEKAKEQVEAAILEYVRERLGDDAWQIDVTLNEAQQRTLTQGKAIRVTGGRYIDAERVQFRIELGEGAASDTWKVDAAVTLPPMVVVATRSLERGEIVTEYDVELVRAEPKKGSIEPLAHLEDVVGKEVTRAVAKGQPLYEKGLRGMLMVQRGQVVTVYARCGGVQIRTTGRAKEDGGLGDLVPVESIGAKETFHARVSGHQEVEIVATSTSVAAVEDVPREDSAWLAERRNETKERPAPRRSTARAGLK